MRRRPGKFRDDTLVLLDQPTEDGMPGAPIGLAAAPHRDRRLLVRWSPWSGPGRRGGAIAAAVIVGMSVAGGTVALESHIASVKQGTLPDIAVVPTFPVFTATPGVSPAVAKTVRTGSATKPAKHPVRTPHVRTSTPPTPPPIVVTYHVDSVFNGGFQGEVDVVNNESQPISGWQIVVALHGDQFQSWWNATGYVSNGILLLYQPSYSGPVAARGGKLRVYFVASGSQMTPKACGFDGVTCTVG